MAILKSPFVQEFLSSIRGVGHPTHPVLDRHYAPISRVPCADLMPFIADRVVVGDTISIKEIMRTVIDPDPGIGMTSSWIDYCIDDVMSTQFERYVSFSSERGLSELKAFFIVAAKDGGDRRFMIADDIPTLASCIFVALRPSWSVNMRMLIQKANRWINTMAKEVISWEMFRKFQFNDLGRETLPIEVEERIARLTPAARMHLFHALKRDGACLPESTTYQIRSLGIDSIRTSKELIDAGFFVPLISAKAVMSAHSKNELIDLCDIHGVNYKKSWTKLKLVRSLEETRPKSMEEIAKSKYLVTSNAQRFPGLTTIGRVADAHRQGFSLLCFA